MLHFISTLWSISPLVLIPLLIITRSKKKKLEGFIHQLLAEKRITVTEFTNKLTEKAQTRAAVRPNYPLPGANDAPPPVNFGSFIGPPLPPEILQKRREIALAEEAKRKAVPDAVRDVTGKITEVKPAETLQPAAEAAAESTPAATVQPVAEVSVESTPSENVQIVKKISAEPTPAMIVQPAQAAREIGQQSSGAGSFGDFIGPPLPPEFIEARRFSSNIARQNYYRGSQVQEKAPAAVRQAPPKPKHTINPASAMLIIGSALVIIAGMIFSTANWNNMTDWQRTGVIAVMAAFFFGVSAVAHRKLKLENTGMAFYMLGSVFTSITFVTVGYFGLLGNWLSVSGGGFWLLYSFAALLVTLFSAGAVKLYKKGAFVHAVLYGGLCSFTLMSIQVFGDSPDMWALVLNVIAAVPLFLLYKQKLRFGSDLYDPQMKLFTGVLTVIYAVAALPFMVTNLDGSWTVPCFLTMLVWIVQSAVYGALLDSKSLKNLHPILVTVSIIELALSIPDVTSANRLLIFGCCAFGFGAVYRYVKPIRTTLSDATFPTVLLCSFFAANNKAVKGGQLLTVMCLLTALCLIHSISKSKSAASRTFTVFLPISVLISDYGLGAFLFRSTELDLNVVYCIVAGAILAEAIVFTVANPIRSILSDAVYPIALLVIYSLSASAWINKTDALMVFAVGAMLMLSMLIHACEDPEKRLVRPYACLLPFAVTIFGQGTAALVSSRFDEIGDIYLVLTVGGVIFAGALAMRFIPRLRSRFSDWVNVAELLLTSFAAHACAADTASAPIGCGITAGITAAFTLMIGLQIFDKSAEKRPAIFTGLMPLASILLAYDISAAIVKTIAPESYNLQIMIVSLIFMLTLFAAAFIFMNVKRLRSVVSAVAFPFALMCCGIYLASQGGARASMLAAVCYLLMAVLMLIQNSEKGVEYDALRIFMWVPFCELSAALASAIESGAGGHSSDAYDLWFGLFLAAFGLAFRYSGAVGANIRTIVSDVAFTVGTCFAAAVSFSEKPLYGLFVSLAAAVLVLANLTEKKPAHRLFVLISRWLFPCVLTLTAVDASSAVKKAAAHTNILYATEGTLVPNLVFILLIAVMSVCFIRIRKIRTIFSDFAIPTALFIGIVSEMDGGRIDLIIASFIGLLVFCGMLLMYALEKDGELHQTIHRIAAPFALLMAVSRLTDLLRAAEVKAGLDDVIPFLSGAVAEAAAASAFTYLSNKQKDKRFSQSQYLWIAVAGLMLVPAGNTVEPSTAAFVLQIAVVFVGAAIYLLCGRQRYNIAAILPSFAMIAAVSGLSYQLAHITGKVSDDVIDDCPAIAAVAAAEFIIFCGISRLTNRTTIIRKNGEGVTIDFAAFAMLAPPMMTLNAGNGSLGEKWSRFIAAAEFGIFFLNLIRKEHERKTNLVMLTFAAAAGCSLIWLRPFLLTDDKMLSAKINIMPLLLFSILIKIIWKDSKKLAGDLSFVVQLTAFGALLFDALTNQSLANTIIVLCVTLGIMLVSFAVRSGRWFAISSASFLGLTVYITRGFVGRIEWWAYLLTAGLILIIVASTNEYLKSNGKSLKDVGRHFLARWKKS
ncbi:MAG: hypothetical protein K6B74_05310 [Ruminococcus sp.]|nr:hypothetical protein [Ruminococcus sp.]